MERDEGDAGSVGEEIQTGWTVVGNSGERIGQVEDIYPDHIVVAKGFLFPSRWRVPASTVARVEHDWVQLSVSRRQVEAQAWDQTPPGGEPAEHTDDVSVDDDQRALTFTDRNVSEGYPIDTRLTLDEIRTRRHPVSSSASTDDVPAGFIGMEIAIPVYGEQAVVHVTPVVREMAVITRTLRERHREFTGALRREEVVVEGDTRLVHDDVTRPYAI